MKYLLILSTTFLFFTHPVDAQWTQLGTDIDGEALADRSGYSVSMPDTNTIAIGAIYNDDNGLESGHVRVYDWNGSTWVQKGADIDGETAYDYSGFSVSMPDANTVAIGAYNNAGNGLLAGHVRIYEWNGSSWVQKGTDIDGEAAGDNSGCAVSMPDANTLAIGARLNDGSAIDAGHARIYEWNGSAWVQKGADIDGEAAGDQSGVSVSMPDANTVAIGATQNGGTGIQAGHVRIYEWNGSAWVQKGADIDGEAAGDFSGTSVSMPDANTAAIGANGNDGNGNFSGHVRIYEWNGSTWVQKGIDIDGEAAAEHSGYSVSMPDPNTVAIGAPDPAISENNGRVRVFEWRCDAWVQKGMDMDGEAVTDQFGNSVSMPDANTVGIGGRQNDGFAFNAGHSRIFSISNLNQLTLSTDSTNAICGESNGSATVTPTGGTAPYTYLWDLSTASQTGSTATNLTAGIYSVTVTDSDCLTAIDSVEVLSSGGSAPDSIDITPSGTVILCPGDSVLLTAETGYETYNWSTLQTGEFIWASEPGEYTVSASNSLGCSSVSDFVIISQGSLPEASFTTEQPSGYLVEFTNTTSNGTEFEWTFPGATTTAQSPTFTFPFDGTYPVTLIASNSCGSDTITTNVEVLKLVGIHDIEVRGLSFEVLPNPSSGAVLLKGETTTPMIYALRVFNVIGQELSNERFTGSGSWVRSLDLGNAGKGVYFVVLENEKGRVSRRLLKL